MQPSTVLWVRSVQAAGLALVLGMFPVARSASAGDGVSQNFRLRGGSLGGGGGTNLQPVNPDSRIGGLSASVGQSSGFSGSATLGDLTTLGSGLWPVVVGEFPTLDIDDDGIQGFLDNCAFLFNPFQVQSLDDPEIGGACLCGDVNDDFTVNDLDTMTFRDFLSDPIGLALSLEGQMKCTVIGEFSDCDVLDVSVLRRTVEGPDLPPGIDQVCEAATPP